MSLIKVFLEGTDQPHPAAPAFEENTPAKDVLAELAKHGTGTLRKPNDAAVTKSSGKLVAGVYRYFPSKTGATATLVGPSAAGPSTGGPSPAGPEWYAQCTTQLSELQQFAAAAGPVLKDLARSSTATRAASKITKADLDLTFNALNLQAVPALDSDDLQSVISTTGELQTDFWSEAYEHAQRKQYAAEIRRHMPQNRALELIDVAEKGPEKVFRRGMMFPLAGKNDELVILRRFHDSPVHGSLFGWEMKKKLASGDLTQAKAEWLLYGLQSLYPYVQVCSDMNHGAVVYYYKGQADSGLHILEQKVFKGMEAVWSFFTTSLRELPPQLGTDEPSTGVIVVRNELPNPKRLKFSGPPPEELSTQAVLQHLDQLLNHDVADLHDLHGWEEGDEEKLSPCVEREERLSYFI